MASSLLYNTAARLSAAPALERQTQTPDADWLNYRDIVQREASAQDVDASLIESVIKAESYGDPTARSSAGAQGLMQLMPATAAEVANELGMGNYDLNDPNDNVRLGTRYLKKMLEGQNGDVQLALAAYNAGPGNVQKYGGIPPFQETQDYVKKVSSYYNKQQPEPPAQKPAAQKPEAPQAGADWLRRSAMQRWGQQEPQQPQAPQFNEAGLVTDFGAPAPTRLTRRSRQGRLSSAGGEFMQGLGRIAASVPRAVGEGAVQLANKFGDNPIFGNPDGVTPEETFSYKVGDTIERWFNKFASNPEYRDDFWTYKIPQGAGTMAGFIMGGIAGQLAKIPALATTMGLGAAATGVEGVEDYLGTLSKDEKADPAMRARAFNWNAGLGTSEGLPIANLLNRLDSITGGGVKKIIAEGFKGGIEELTQEVIQQTGQNAIANGILAYDPDRDMFDGTVEAGQVGFTLGFLLNTAAAMIGARRAGRASEPVAEEETTTEIPEEDRGKPLPAVDIIGEEMAGTGVPLEREVPVMEGEPGEAFVGPQPVRDAGEVAPPDVDGGDQDQPGVSPGIGVSESVDATEDQFVEPEVPAPKTSYFDARLKRGAYRDLLTTYTDELTPGGDVQLISAEGAAVEGVTDPAAGALEGFYPSEETTRTPSVNPEWFQSMMNQPDYKMSVQEVWKARDKALAGERLGVRQQRVVEGILDQVTQDRITNELPLAREALQKARDARLAAGMPDMPDWLLEEQDYLAEWDSQERSFRELHDEAKLLGGDLQDQVEALLGSQQDDAAIHDAIIKLIKEYRDGQQIQSRPEGYPQPEARAGAPDTGYEPIPGEPAPELARPVEPGIGRPPEAVAPAAEPELTPQPIPATTTAGTQPETATAPPMPTAATAAEAVAFKEGDEVRIKAQTFNNVEGTVIYVEEDQGFAVVEFTDPELGFTESSDISFADLEMVGAREDRRKKAQPGRKEERRTLADRRRRWAYRKEIEQMSMREREAVIQQLRQDALVNQMTGLGSRLAWEDVDKKTYIAAIDADSLKYVNDALGNKAGDALLIEIGKAFKARFGDDAYHISGDEYWIHGEDSADLVDGLTAIQQEMKGVTVEGPGGTLTGLGFSYGVADNEELADRKMKQDKIVRQDAGMRVERGERPPGVVLTKETAEEAEEADLEAVEEAPLPEDIEVDEYGIEELQIPFNEFEAMVDEVAELFAEQETLRAQKKAPAYISQGAANKQLEEWQAHAQEQGANDRSRSENNNRWVISLFDRTGVISAPWVEAGYNVIHVDIENGIDINDMDIQWWADNYGEVADVYAILAQPPCTDFASSGARWFKQKDEDGRTEASIELVNQVFRTLEFFRPTIWALENPVGRIRKLTGLPKPTLIFQPHHYGDPYTKKTLLWGRFNNQLPFANVEPTEGSLMHKLRGDDPIQKLERSVTPEGFAYAFFMANNAIDNYTREQELAYKITQAVTAGDEQYEAELREELDDWRQSQDTLPTYNGIGVPFVRDLARPKKYPGEKPAPEAKPKAEVGKKPKPELELETQTEEQIKEKEKIGKKAKPQELPGTAEERQELEAATFQLGAPEGQITPDEERQVDLVAEAEKKTEVGKKKVEQAAEQVETEPSEAQIEAGNYQKGHVSLHGLDISIETPKGERRRPEWPPMAAHYGYIKRSEGRDGEQVDVFLTDDAGDPDRMVYVINQVDPESPTGAFDEHKVVLGAKSRGAAMGTYMASYSRGWGGLPSSDWVAELTLEEFKKWLLDGDTTKRLVTEKKDKVPPSMFALKGEFKPFTGPDFMPAHDDAGWAEAWGAMPDNVAAAVLEALNKNAKAIADKGMKWDTPSTVLMDFGLNEQSSAINELTALVELTSKLWGKDKPQRLIEYVRDIEAVTGVTGLTDGIEVPQNQVHDWGDQRGKAAKYVGRLLHHLRIQSAVLDGDDFHLRVPNGTYLDLHIERHPDGEGGQRLYLTHYVEAGGDTIIDSEMVFQIHEGRLFLVDTAVRGIMGEVRGKDGAFANVFAKNLIDQGFNEVQSARLVDAAAKSELRYLAGRSRKDLNTYSAQALLDVLWRAGFLTDAKRLTSKDKALIKELAGKEGRSRANMILAVKAAGKRLDAEALPVFSPETRPSLGKMEYTHKDSALRTLFTVADEADTSLRGRLDIVSKHFGGTVFKASEHYNEDAEPIRGEKGWSFESRDGARQFYEYVTGMTYDTQAEQIEHAKDGQIAPKKKRRKADYGSKNKVVTQSAADAARERLRKKLGQLNAGLDPEMMQDAITLTIYHLEAGAHSFGDYAGEMIADLGDIIRPYLRSLYEQARYNPDTPKEVVAQMTPAGEIDENAILTVEVEDAPSTDVDLEPDQPATGDTLAGDADVVPADTGRAGQEPRPAGQDFGEIGEEQQGNRGIPVDSPASGGSTSDSGVYQQDGLFGVAEGTAEHPDGGRSPDVGPDGTRTGREPADRAQENAGRYNDELKAKKARQDKANSLPVVLGDLENIRETLPYLLPEQHDDVLKYEQRVAADKAGMMFTNGTGTGKTYTGLGIIARHIRSTGDDNVVIVVPTDPKAKDWIEDAANLGINATQLKDKKDAGEGVVVTTYANFRDNWELQLRDISLFVPDESHYLKQNKGLYDATASLIAFRALTSHDKGLYDKVRFRDPEAKALEYQRREFLNSEVKRIEQEYQRKNNTDNPLPEADREDARIAANKLFHEQHNEEYIAEHERIREKVKPLEEAYTRPANTVFLSASPFSYHFSLDYAEGYLFDYGRDKGDSFRGYNQPDPAESFYVANLGYRMRTGKLTQPDAEVNIDLMERELHERLKSEGAISGRQLDVPYDYSREFIQFDSELGTKIDEGINLLNGWDKQGERSDEATGYEYLPQALRKKFNATYLSQLREGVNAQELVERIRKHLDLGRKVVIFHDFQKAISRHPFDLGDLSPPKMPTDEAQMAAFVQLQSEIEDFRLKYPQYPALPIGRLKSVVDTVVNAFGADRVGIINGRVSNRVKSTAKKRFNEDGSGMDIIVVQRQAGREGISLHDTTGTNQRALIDMGLPIAPVDAIQTEGRIFRVGVQSNSAIEYAVLKTNFERLMFAMKVAERSRTAENLAMGSHARALEQAFREGYLNSTDADPSMSQGTGTKEGDRRIDETTDFDRAKTYYYGRMKNTKRRDQREGVDYFSTPEPLGLKMVEWANPRAGDRMLEPSAGHGAIARWFPENTSNVFVEPSSKLGAEVSLISHGEFIASTFENVSTESKFDAIVMNPPYGSGGATAMQHLEKAMNQLKNGGRIVALIPTGPAADKKFDKLFYGQDGELEKIKRQHKDGLITGTEYNRRLRQLTKFHMVANITLPRVTFERAGTSVATRIVILDRYDNDADYKGTTSTREYSAETINEFFDRIEHAGVNDRYETTKPEPKKPTGAAALFTGRDAKLEAPAVEEPLSDNAAYLSDKGLEVEFTETRGGTPVWQVSGNTKAYKHILGAKTRGGLGGKWYGPKQVWSFYKADPTDQIAERIRKEEDEPRFSRSRPVTSGYSRKRGKGAPGMAISEVEAIIEEFKQSFANPLNIEFRAYYDKADLLGEEQAAQVADETIKGAYYGRLGMVALVSSDLESRNDAIQTLRHELVAHHGLNLFRPAEKETILRAVSNSRGVRSLRKIWEQVDQDYADLDELKRAEEVIALIAQNKQGRLTKAWAAIVTAIRNAMRAIGLIGNTTSKAEVLDLINTMEKGLHLGMPQQTFPATNEAQFEMNQEIQGVYYQQMARYLGEKLNPSGKAKGYIETVKSFGKKGHFKNEELEWSGLIPWLESQGDRRIEKTDILQFIRMNKIRIKEKMLTSGDIDTPPSLRSELEEVKSFLKSEGIEVWFDEEGRINGVTWKHVSNREAKQARYDAMEFREVLEHKGEEHEALVWQAYERGREFGGRQWTEELARQAALEWIGLPTPYWGDAWVTNTDIGDLEKLLANPITRDAINDDHQSVVTDDIERLIRISNDIDEAFDDADTVYNEWTLPGGEDYRELLLRLDTGEELDPRSVLGDIPEELTPDAYEQRTGAGIELDPATTILWYPNDTYIFRFGGADLQAGGKYGVQIFNREQVFRNLSDAEEFLVRAFAIPEGLSKQQSTAYVDPNFGYENILAHIRFTTRELPTYTSKQIDDIGERIREAVGARTVDQIASGGPKVAARKGAITGLEMAQYSHSRGFRENTFGATAKVLMIEEIQSDWHQAGRKEGYFDKEAAQRFENEYNDWLRRPAQENIMQLPAEMSRTADSLAQATRHITDEQEQWLISYMNRYDDEVGTAKAVPPAPFKTTWHMLATKRMLRYAVDNGFDRIAWTSGKQQADRYNLSKYINSLQISLMSTKIAGWSFEGYNDNGHVVSKYDLSEAQMEEHIGKELFAKAKATIEQQVTDAEALPREERLSMDADPYFTELTGLDLAFGGEGMIGFYDRMLPKNIGKYVKQWDAKPGVMDFPIGGDPNAQVWDVIREDDGANLMTTGDHVSAAMRASELTQQTGKKHFARRAKLITEPIHYIDVTPKMREGAAQEQPMFSRTGGSRGPQERQRTMQGDMNAGQPIDKAFRAAFDLIRVPKVTRKAHAKAADWIVNGEIPNSRDGGVRNFLNGVLNTARAGLIDRYGLPEDYIHRDFEASADKRKIELQGLDILKVLENGGVTNVAEAEALQAILTGEAMPVGAWESLTPPIREAIDQLGQEAKELGLISAEAFEKNKGTYLHRVYKGHEAVQTRLNKWIAKRTASRRKAVRGEELKGRGMFNDVAMNRLLRDVPPEWWQRKEQQGQADKALHKAEFFIFDLPEAIGQGTEELIKGGKRRKPRIKHRVYWPADLPVPAKFGAYENKGKWIVRDVSGQKTTLWRDFTRDERERMGEMLDARYTIAKTFMLMAHDLSTGRFLKDISENEEWATRTEPDNWVNPKGVFNTYSTAEWVKVPIANVEGTKVKKWGALAGMYVRAEIWRDLNELDRMQTPNFWQSILTQWKLNKTARNPVVHMNNIMSNMVFMDMADIRWRDLKRGIMAYRNKDENYRDALEHGAFGGSFLEHEIRRDILDPILQELMQQDKALQTGPMENWLNAREWGAKMSVLGKIVDVASKKIGKADRWAVGVYQLEDEVFRMATYMHRREKGDDEQTAARIARDQFLNYDIRAPWVNAARRSFLPFISYTYRAVPVIAKSLAERPWKLAKYATIAYMMNMLGYLMGDDAEDEEEQRKSMNERVHGYTWIGTPRMIRSPIPFLNTDAHGNPIFLDVRRWVPAGDVFDMSQSQGAIPVPAWLQFGGPLMIAAELMLNKQAFTGKQIYNPKTDTGWEQTGEVGGFLWRSWMPSAPWIPGSWYWEKISRAGSGARDLLGHDYSVPLAVFSSFGVKLVPHDVDLGFQFHARNFNSVRRELEWELRQLGQDRERRLIDNDEYTRQRDNLKAKMERLNERAEEVFGK